MSWGGSPFSQVVARMQAVLIQGASCWMNDVMEVCQVCQYTGIRGRGDLGGGRRRRGTGLETRRGGND